MRSALKTFYDSLATGVGCGWTVGVRNSGDTIDDVTGQINGTWSAGSVTTSGSSSAAHAAGVGLEVRWDTVSILNGRRVRGQTKVIPIASSLYASDGTLASGTITTVENAISALRTSIGASMMVFSRPYAGRGAVSVGFRVPHPLPAISARSGSSHAISAGSCPDHVATLKSRRT
jgi:hypothetical protein